VTLLLRVRATRGYATPTTRGTLPNPPNDGFSFWGPRFRSPTTGFFLGTSFQVRFEVWTEYWESRFRSSKVLRTSLVSRPHPIHEISFRSISCQLGNNCHRHTNWQTRPPPTLSTKHTTRNGQCLENKQTDKHHCSFNI